MSDVFQVKQGDSPAIVPAALKDTGGGALNLTDAQSVSMRVKQVVSTGSPVKYTAACTITNAAGGVVEAPATTTTPGIYAVEFVITWVGGRTQTVPNNGTAVLQVLPNLA